MVRALSAQFGYFSESDDIAIAAGVAALRNDSITDLYRYGPQVGYYQLVKGLSALAGSDLIRVPAAMVWMSVVAGVTIPIAGLLSFRHDFSRQERWLLFLILAANPILWLSSRYGNSAMPSVALAVTAAAILSNRPRWPGELLALGLFASAIVVRADAVLVTAGIGVLLWRNHGAFRPAAIRIVATGVAVAAVFAALFLADPRMAGLTTSVVGHLTNVFESYFWEYLLWAMSPLVLGFAVLGARELATTRRWIALALAAWSLPVVAFYYRAITTPRYFLLLVFPLAVAATVGLVLVAGPWRGRLTWRTALALTAASVHLLVVLDRAVPATRRSWLTQGEFRTHDGEMWTGALLYKSLWARRPWNASVFGPPLGRLGAPDSALTAGFSVLVRNEVPEARIVLVADRGWTLNAHFFAQVFRARVRSADPAGEAFSRRTDMELGETPLTMIGKSEFDRDSLLRLPVAPGEQLWIVARSQESSDRVRHRLPAALRLVPLPPLPGARLLERYSVEAQ